MLGGDSLMARLGLDTSGFKAGLKDAHSAFSQLAGKIGVGLSVSGIASYTKGIAEYGARVFDLGKRYEVSTDAIQKFGNAAEQNGSSLEGVARGFNKLDIAISKALGGNETILKSFSALGITIADLRNLSPEEIMKKLGSSSLNAADMVKVLGKSALELRPLLKGIADGSIELGDAIEKGQIQKLKEAEKAWKKFWEAATIHGAAAITADPIPQHKNQGGDIVLLYKSMRTGIEAEFKFLKAATTGDLKEMQRQAAITAKAIEEAYRGRGRTSAVGIEAGVKGPRAKPPESAADKKDRERDQLSLKDLAGEGPDFARRGPGNTYNQSGGTAQMIYATQQAKVVEQLEGQAKQVRLTGVSATGETSAGLLRPRRCHPSDLAHQGNRKRCRRLPPGFQGRPQRYEREAR